jgi:hypothetical protein
VQPAVTAVDQLLLLLLLLLQGRISNLAPELNLLLASLVRLASTGCQCSR